MNNPPRDEEYKTLEKTSKTLYKNIGDVLRPKWHERISFTADGFRHLIWKRKHKRKEKERVKRLNLLPYAAEIIASGKLESIRNKKKIKETIHHGEKGLKESEAKFWAFSDVKNGQRIIVVVRQLGNGKKHFFSIFEDDKNKKLPQ